MTRVPLTLKSGAVFNVEVYSVEEFARGIDQFLSKTDIKHVKNSPRATTKYYYNQPLTFDIETTKIRTDRGEYFTFMYHWQMTVNGFVVFGRTWDEWRDLLLTIKHYLNLNSEVKARIFVHNLSYEFGFFKSQIPIGDVFARKTHHPIHVHTAGDFGGFEFLCTYSISGYSLENLAKNITAIPIEKLKGDLDYNIIRTRDTKLTLKEKQYCLNDVLILHHYILYLMSQEKQKNIGAIPLTKTGFVRRSARETFGKNNAYRKWVDSIHLNTEQFILYNRAFMGGDTHANALHCGKIMDGVESYDLTSSYPYRFLVENFPLSKAVTSINPSVEVLRKIIQRDYLYIARITILNVRQKSIDSHTYIQSSKCEKLSNDCVFDNGRVVRASALTITLTSVDWNIVYKNYDFDIGDVLNIVYHTQKGLLPKVMRDYIINLYRDKTMLKGVQGEEVNYMLSKERINSLYGMCVTSPIRSKVDFNPNTLEWSEHTPQISFNNVDEIAQQLTEFYQSRNNFLPYQIGVWVTAYARYDLHRPLDILGNKAIYWDTDSVKHCGDSGIFDVLNNEKLSKILSLGYDIEDIAPRDMYGNRHLIGEWECEYNTKYRFKTFGAKKYFTDINGEQSLTVSGLNKKIAVPYLKKKLGNVLKVELGEIFPPEYSGRTTIEYCDVPFTMIIDGVECCERSYINLLPTTYTLNDTIDHLMYICEVNAREIIV